MCLPGAPLAVGSDGSGPRQPQVRAASSRSSRGGDSKGLPSLHLSVDRGHACSFQVRKGQSMSKQNSQLPYYIILWGRAKAAVYPPPHTHTAALGAAGFPFKAAVSRIQVFWGGGRLGYRQPSSAEPFRNRSLFSLLGMDLEWCPKVSLPGESNCQRGLSKDRLAWWVGINVLKMM